MCCLDSELSLEPGLDIQEIEKRLVATAARYDREERYIAYYLLEVENRNLCEEIAERQAEQTLEPWQVLEQMMAEYLSTYAAAEKECQCAIT